MTDPARFRASFSGVEIEIEGPADFVREQISLLNQTIAYLGSQKTKLNNISPATASTDEVASDEEADQNQGTGGTESVPATFGEWMHRFRASLSESDKALITARFVQSQATTNDFKTSEVNKSLRDHGIKLGNPSRELGRLASRKLMFQVRKVGKLKFFRVSVDGQKHLDTLLRGG